MAHMTEAEIIELASETAINWYKKEVEAAEKQKEKNKIKQTKGMLESYRRVKARLNSEKTFTDEEKASYRWKFIEDLMGDAKNIVTKSELIIKEEEKRRQEDMYALYRIDNALELYKHECELSQIDEERRRYRIINKMYIDDEPMTVEELMEIENVSKDTVYRDMRIATKILSIYLYGI